MPCGYASSYTYALTLGDTYLKDLLSKGSGGGRGGLLRAVSVSELIHLGKRLRRESVLENIPFASWIISTFGKQISLHWSISKKFCINRNNILYLGKFIAISSGNGEVESMCLNLEDTFIPCVYRVREISDNSTVFLYWFFIVMLLWLTDWSLGFLNDRTRKSLFRNAISSTL